MTGTDLRLAEQELVGFFTGAIGVRAQNYEAFDTGGRGAFDSDGAVINRMASQKLALAHHDMVEGTLVRVDGWSRWVLGRVYTPKAWCGEALALVLNGFQVPHNLAAVAALTARAQRFAGRHGEAADNELAVLHLLEGELKRFEGASPTGGVLDVVRAEAEAFRVDAVTAYEHVRRTRPGAILAAPLDRESERMFVAMPSTSIEDLLAGRS